MEVLNRKNLKCHLKCKLRSDHNFTESHMRDKKAKTKRRIFLFPMFTVAYCCTLDNLHTIKGIRNFYEVNKVTEEVNSSIKKRIYQPEKRWLDCDFNSRENRLKLKEFENRKNLESHTNELHEFIRLWATKGTETAVYTIKAVTFICSGPSGILMAIHACKTVLLLTRR